MSSKDIKKGLILPEVITKDLSYLCGVFAGDGSINIRKFKHDYELKCAGNPKDEIIFYENVICPLMKKIFNLEVEAKFFDKGTTYGIRFWSRALVEFLTNVLELPVGSKYSGLKIPDKILINPRLVESFIQGVADTDFCLTLKRRREKFGYYPCVVGATKSRSFAEELARELEKRGIKVNKYYDYIVRDARFKAGFSKINRLEIAGHNQLMRWMNLIGFRNPKHLKKFKKWKYFRNV